MKAALHNLGCKTNSYETEAMEQALREAGYEIVAFAGDEPADVYIVNTCSVTNIADRKSRQMLHKARASNPGAVLVAVGCFVQTSSAEDLEKEGIDICLGSNDKGKLLDAISEFIEKGRPVNMITDLWQADRKDEYEALSVSEKPKHTRAFIKIEDGCDQFCTFCIIPYARGRVRSRELKDILAEAETLAGQGIKEIVLTGINMSAYGKDLADSLDMGDILLKLNGIDGLERIRISSLEPGLVSREFLEKIKPVTKLCPHFHLSLQSGSDSVLKRMNRHYTCEDYLVKCDLLREYYDDPGITTDVITGFPGETDEEFRETAAFVRKAGFFDMHIFSYSPREGTPAAKMPDQVDGRTKRIRSALLIQEAAEMKREKLKSARGKVDEVLIEEVRSLDLADYCGDDRIYGMSGKEFYVGHTSRYMKIIIPVENGDKPHKAGDMVKVLPEDVAEISDGELVLLCIDKKTKK